MVYIRKWRKIYWKWQSDDSTDSGRGGSEIHFEGYPANQESNMVNYAFEIEQRYVGRLIGRQGNTVKDIKDKTGADILIKGHPSYNHTKICVVSGTQEEVDAALKRIREKFPPKKYPTVTLTQMCILSFMPIPDNLMLRLPEGSSFDVLLSCIIDAGHFFVQQPTHPTYHSLPALAFQMASVYNQDVNAPPLPHMEVGYVCAAIVDDVWYRAEIVAVFYETDECRLKMLDYGGYVVMSRSKLRQINYCFMNMPFQATECYLGLATVPEGETEWSDRANEDFSDLTIGHILQGYIIAYAEDGVPFVQLYRVAGMTIVDINNELIRRGCARSIEPPEPEPLV